MDIKKHPIWEQVTPYKTKISPFKKPFHILRILLARQYAKLFPKSYFIGVTGSVGKTACVVALKAILSTKYHTVSTLPALDPILNIPMTLLKLGPSVKRVILEMGIEYPGEMDLYLSIVRPQKAIVTKISYAHSQYLGDLENILEEKGRLVEKLPEDGLAVLNWDDWNCRKLASKTKAKVVYFGKDSSSCLVWANNIKIEDFKTIFELNFGVERVKISHQFLGEHSVYPALAAATLGILEGISLVTIKRVLESIEPPQHRLQALIGPNGSVILDDTYNSSPAAVDAAIDTLMSIPARRRVVVLGEMRELGTFSEKLHRQIAAKIYKEKIDLCLLGQGDANFIADELQRLGFLEERMHYNLSKAQIVQKLLNSLAKGDICLIKGSRAVRLDEIIARIRQKEN